MQGGEVQAFHTRILRVTLAAQESRAYWEAVDPTVIGTPRLERAFNERWFGNKSLARVRLLLANFALRFDAYPSAFETLRRWKPLDPLTRSLVCHWHVQLADPLYRTFTGTWLTSRAEAGIRSVDRDVVARWIASLPEASWAPATRYMFATKLLRSADEAGLFVTEKRSRTIATPRVPDEALGYLIRLLQVVPHTGTFYDNAYLRSVGLEGEALDARLRRLPEVHYRRMGELVELQTSPLESYA